MKKYVLLLFLSIFSLGISCGNANRNITHEIENYIKKNKLPVTVGEEISVYDDYSISDKTKFQIFMMELIQKLTDDISEGNFNDKTIADLTEAQKILIGYYNYCLTSNYEMPIIFRDTLYEKNIVIEYLKYHHYPITFYNGLVVVDNDTDYNELKDLLGMLQQIGDIKRNNTINYFSNYGNETIIYKNTVFEGGVIKVSDINNYEDFDVVKELELVHICNSLIGEIAYLFGIKGYNLDEYENIRTEIINGNTELERVIDIYNQNRQ